VTTKSSRAIYKIKNAYAHTPFLRTSEVRTHTFLRLTRHNNIKLIIYCHSVIFVTTVQLYNFTVRQSILAEEFFLIVLQQGTTHFTIPTNEKKKNHKKFSVQTNPLTLILLQLKFQKNHASDTQKERSTV
jgi:hypothetical protein